MKCRKVDMLNSNDNNGGRADTRTIKTIKFTFYA